MRQQEERFEQLDVRVKVITFDANGLAMAYVKSTSMKWPLLLDKERLLYRAYGMEQASWWALLNPLAIWKYIVIILSGTKWGTPGKDLRQLGGNVLIDPHGVVRLHHASADPHDRPSVESIFNLVQSDVHK